MTDDHDVTERLWRLAPGLVFGLAALAALWGLGSRDFSGEELGRLTGLPPLGLIASTLEPRHGHFSGHLPLSHMARWTFVELFRSDAWFAWRLHSALASIGAAMVGWWLFASRGDRGAALLLGVLVALHPMLAHHSHDSSNYATSALFGALLLVSATSFLERKRGGALALAAVLTLGATNDFFFALPAAVVLALCVVAAARAADRRQGVRRLAKVCLPPALILGGPILLFVSRMTEANSAELVHPFADAAVGVDTAAAWEAAGNMLNSVAGAYLSGYQEALVRPGWELVGPLALLCASVVSAWLAPRSVRLRVAAAVVVGTLLLTVVIQMLMFSVGGRVYPTAGRTFMHLLVPLAVLWVGAIRQVRSPTRIVLALALVGIVGLSTLRQLADLSMTETWLEGRLAELRQPGDLVVSRTQGRFDLLSRTWLARCLDTKQPLPPRIWHVARGLAEPSEGLPVCDGASVSHAQLGYRVRSHSSRLAPVTEGRSDSYMPGRSLTLLDQSTAPTVRPVRGEVVFEPAVWSGMTGREIQFRWSVDQDWKEHTAPFPPSRRIQVPSGALEAPTFHVAPIAPARDQWNEPCCLGFFTPLGAPLPNWKELRVISGSESQSWSLQPTPLGSTRLDMLLRALRTFVGLSLSAGVLLAILRRRRS